MIWMIQLIKISMHVTTAEYRSNVQISYLTSTDVASIIKMGGGGRRVIIRVI